MSDTPTSSDDRTGPDVSRRRFLQAATATGVGAAALSTGAATATAAGELRDEYWILYGTEHQQKVYYYRAPNSGPCTMVVGGIHGDEEAGYRAADQIKDWTVDRGELVVVPRANPSAIADNVRPWDPDLNRQFPPTGGGCESALAQKLWDVVEHHDPDWVLDLHSSRGIYQSGDGGVGQAVFPTWTSPARSTGENTVAALNDAFSLSGDLAYLMGNTLDADRDMLLHRVAGVLDRPGFICETTEKAPLEEQIRWHLFTVEHVMAQYGQRRVEGGQTADESGQTADEPTVEARALTVDDPWQSYGLSNTYDAPRVFLPAVTNVGPQPCHTRVRNVSSGGFDAKVEEWLYQNGVHYDEQSGMLAIESGVHDLSAGPMEVGAAAANHAFTAVGFEADFGEQPVVLTQSQTEVGEDPIVSRTRNVSPAGMELRVQEEDGEENGGYHYTESVAYLAVEPCAGSLSGRAFEAGTTTSDHTWSSISFDQQYDDPVFLASTQSFAGWNSVTVRYRNLTGSGVDVMLQEEQSDDGEMNHVTETVGYLVVEA